MCARQRWSIPFICEYEATGKVYFSSITEKRIIEYADIVPDIVKKYGAPLNEIEQRELRHAFIWRA